MKKLFLSYLIIFPIMLNAMETKVPSSSSSVEVTKKSKVFYLHIKEISPSQLRYSSFNVDEKIEEMKKHKDTVWDETREEWKFKYFSGKSPLPEKEAVPLIKAPFGYVLADGHHHVKAAEKLGAEWVPVYLLADMSDLDEEDFWKQSEQLGWAYLNKTNGKKGNPPKSFSELQDDPNRYFAALIARKCDEKGDLKTSKGSDYPVWIKVGKDIPFIEFRISDALWKHNISYDYSMGKNPPVELVEKARSALKEENIPGLRLVAERVHYSEISLN